MKKLWLRALTAATLIAGVCFGTVALAGDRHGGHYRNYDQREYRHHNYHGGHGHHRHHDHCGHRRDYYRPYPVVREVYYAPEPRYYSEPRYYEPAPVYYGGRSGVSGSVTVHF